MSDDLGPNKAHLYAVASEAKEGDVLVDLGVRFGVSSGVMMDATEDAGARVVGVDVGASPFGINYRYTFLQCDSISASQLIPPPIFLCFIDTIHVKEQVLAELHHYWPKIRVGGYAVFHDTEWGGRKDHYMGKDWEPPVEAVKAFFGLGDLKTAGRTTNFEYRHCPESWGMTFVQKLADWNPIVPEMDEALKASKLLTESLFPR